MIRISDIDTKRFGVVSARADDVAAADLNAVDDFCKANKVKFLIARCSADSLDAAQALEDNGCRLMDTLVYFKFDFATKKPPAFGEGVVRDFRAGEEIAVREISRDAFHGFAGGHYHADPKISRDVSADIYADWAYNSCKGAADHVLVAEVSGAPAGFLTLKKDGEIPLNAVAPKHQRRGIYRSLVTHALHWLEKQAPAAVISTQVNNLPVQKVWSRLGFEPDGAVYTFHKWF